MTPEEEDRLVEEVAGAYRPRGRDELRYHPAWHDLAADGRQKAYDRALALRAVEAAADPSGLSATARAVLGRISGE